ncbi:MAG: hypothetical protein AB7Q29_17625 [Vicinamibacterales bacterium]
MLPSGAMTSDSIPRRVRRRWLLCPVLAMMPLLCACRPLDQAADPTSANVLLAAVDPADPTCAAEGGIGWVLYQPEREVTAQIVVAAIPDARQASQTAGACVYSASLATPPSTVAEWSVRATDEASWVATCTVTLVQTGPTLQNNVVRFTRGMPGCDLNPGDGIPR